MEKRELRAGLLAALIACATNAPVWAHFDGITIAYHLTHKCPTTAATGPGSSPDNPIVLEEFDEAWQDAVRAIEDAAEEGKSEPSRFECKWIKLSGYFRWTDYYDYRGRLYASANAYYFDEDASYLIKDFADRRTRRSEFQASEIELVGQFYDLCAHAPVADMVFGPCHYGGYQGMMLADVRVLSVAKERFQILTGEANRIIVDSLHDVPADWSRSDEVVQSARDWLKLLASGRRAYERAISSSLDAMKREERKNYFDPDGWVATLLDPKRNNLSGKDFAALPFKVFYQPIAEDREEPDIHVTACACLEGNCDDAWPLFSDDATRLKEKFICLELKEDVLGKSGRRWIWTE